jgi:sulfoxide reductase heme-binding subunit YedZ
MMGPQVAGSISSLLAQAPWMPRGRQPYPWLKPGILLGALVPLAYLSVRATRDQLGANPVAQLENELGMTALVFLVASLMCSPARWLLGWAWPIRIRRELGLFAFFYASIHFVTYLALDQFFAFDRIVEDIVERPFITVGFAALVLLVPLAITSTNDWIRRLGYQRWLRLHQLVYLAGVLAVIHYVWRVKVDVSQPLIYGAVIAGLLAIRLGFWLKRRANAKRRAHAS